MPPAAPHNPLANEASCVGVMQVRILYPHMAFILPVLFINIFII